MERFNPITDLQPIDPVSFPTADISDEIESLRLTLIQTKKETDNVINIIKDKNSSLNSDLKKIKNLNRRLNITIPRIPSMPGKAGVQFGEEVEEEKRRKRSGIRLPRLPLIPFPSKVPKFKRPRLRKFALNTKKALDVYGAFQVGKVGINIVKDPKALNKIVKTARDLTKTPMLSPVLSKTSKASKTVNKGRGATTGNFFQGAINRVKKIFAPKKNEVPLSVSERMRISDLTRKNFPKVSREGILIRKNAKIKKDLLNLEKKIPEFEIFQFMKKANLKSPTLLKSNLNKTYTKEYQKILKAYKQNKIGVQDMLEQTDTLRKAYDTNALRIDRYGEEIMAIFERFKMRGLGTSKTKPNVIMKDVLEGITNIKKQIPKPLENLLGKVDAKSMTNDIAMLNTDTGVTNTVIILTDPPIA